MSGTLRGSIEHLHLTANDALLRDNFASIVRFFDSHPQMVRIASQRGGTGFAGTSSLALPGYTGETDQSGENAFGVWRWDRVDGVKLYILLQWGGWASTFGNSPGAPGVVNNSYAVGIQFALDTSGGNPWTGLSNDDGLDTKGATPGTGPVWAAAGGSLVVWPRANGIVGGSGSTDLQYFANLTYYSNTARISVLADDDAIWVFCDNTKDGGYDNRTFFGPYVPRSDITPDTGVAFVLISENINTGAVPEDTAFGSTAGNTNYEGGACINVTDGVRTFKHAPLAYQSQTTYQVSTLTGSYDIMDVYLRMADASAPVRYGFFGRIDPSLLAFVSNLSTNDTNVGLTRVVVGSTTLSHLKWLAPWDGATVPGSGYTQAGVQFP